MRRLIAIPIAILLVLALSVPTWSAEGIGTGYRPAMTSTQAMNGGFTVDTTGFSVNGSTYVIGWIPTTTTSNAGVFDFSTLTSGNGLKLIGVDATLNGGKYINIYGVTGTTSMWSVAEDGVTAITPVQATSDALTLTNAALTTGDLLVLDADDDTLTTGGYYIECLGSTDHATDVFTVGEGGQTAITSTTAAAAVDAFAIAGNVLTTGDLVSLTADNDLLNGGKYLNCIGGTGADTAVFTIAEDGVTAISSVVATSQSLSITNNVATTGDLVVLTADDDTLTTGGYYLNCLGASNHATSVFSIAEGGATTITPTTAAIAVDALTIDGTLTTTGDAIQITFVDATLDGGKYINCLGGTGSTAEFTVAEGGDVVVAGSISQTKTNAASGSANPYDYTATAGIMNGSDDVTVFDVNLTNANHTGESNTIQVLDVANITGDDECTETAIKIGTGWDAAITASSLSNLDGGIAVDTSNFTVSGTTGAVATASTIGQTLVNGAGASANPYDYTGTLGIMDSNDTFQLFDINITNADHTGTTNVVEVMNVANITGDDHATETAINIGTGWDAAMTAASLVNLNAGLAMDSTVFTIADTTGVVSSVPTTTTSNAWTIDGTALTSGNLVKLIGVDATLDGGKYINVYGGTNNTSVWSVAEGGATLITPNVAAINPFYIDGTVTTTGNFATFKAIDATLNGGLYFNLLGGNGSVAVWTVGEDGATAISSTQVATNSFSITNNVTTSGDLITLTADDDSLDADTYYITMLGGTDHATACWSVGEGGQTLITPTAAAITADAFSIDGTLLTSGDFISLKAIDGTLNGGLYINCLGGAAGATAEFTVAEGGAVVANGQITHTGLKGASGSIVTNTDGGETLTAAQSGFLIVCTKSDGATTITLPDPSAATVGVTYEIMQVADQVLNVVPTTADGNSIVALNVATSDKVSCETGGQKIGSGIRIIGISATQWFAEPMAGTMTVEAAD